MHQKRFHPNDMHANSISITCTHAMINEQQRESLREENKSDLFWPLHCFADSIGPDPPECCNFDIVQVHQVTDLWNTCLETTDKCQGKFPGFLMY